jgi:tetratricopeptide (TPR) repeat protein
MGMGMGGMNMMGMGGMNMMGMGGMNMMGMGGMNMMGMGGMMMGGMNFLGGAYQGGFNGSLGAVGATQAPGLIDLITRIVDPGNWNQPPQLTPFMMMGGFPGPGMIGMLGMVGMMGMGMIGAGPPPDPNINVDPQTSNSIDFFPPALAIIVRAPSRIHTSITGGIIGGKGKRLEPAAMLEIERKGLAQFQKDNPGIKIAQKDLDKANQVLAKKREEIDPAKVWNETMAKGGLGAGHLIASADFLFESGEFKHAAELLKANLRFGVVVRPWVFESLAVALEASGGDKDEIRRARLSGIALDPKDAQSFLSAARAMADQGHHERAIAFCRQAADLEPNDFHPYEVALNYAENAKDIVAMEWAAGNLVSQDWPVDNVFIQSNVQKRVRSLATTLKSENRAQEADRIEGALKRLNQRDLLVQLSWENAGGPAELEMKVTEPSGSVCNLDQRQSPGGGVMIPYNLTDKSPSSQYVVAQGFSGEYVVDITRVYGQPLANRARLLVVQNAGTPQESRRLEIVRLDQNAPIRIKLDKGRRTELASVSPAANQRKVETSEAGSNPFYDLRAVANPNFWGANAPRGGAGTPGMLPSQLAAKDTKSKTAPTPIMQNAINTGGGVQMTAQVRLNADQRGYDMVIRPFFDAASKASRSPNLSVIPGGGN